MEKTEKADVMKDGARRLLDAASNKDFKKDALLRLVAACVAGIFQHLAEELSESEAKKGN